MGCCCYHKGTYFQANHNTVVCIFSHTVVVVATTKVRIFKQITTCISEFTTQEVLLLLPQRYVFSSKSQRSFQPILCDYRCCCYHKGTYFQANHNYHQVTLLLCALLLLPQRYVFSSKSQQSLISMFSVWVVVATTKVRIFKQITTLCSLE